MARTAEVKVHLADYAEVREAVAIVRAVAACEPMAYCPGDEMSGDWYECGFCEAQADATSQRGVWGEVKHHASCEWQRAKTWVDAHPADA